MIKIKDLNKHFAKHKVLNEINLQFNAGECVALIGPNGSGKTTLIKSILALVTIEKGEIHVQNENIRNQSDYRSKIGYMPQINRFPEHMSVQQLFKMMKSIRQDVTDYDLSLYEAFNIDNMRKKKLGILSGGMRQKVSAALAFLFKPEILILDEPTAGLDPVSNEILKKKLKEAIEKENKLVLITSHILNDLDDIADRVVYLMDGSLYFDKQMTALKEETSESRLNKIIASILNTENHYV
ncbi:ABC transporter ATP-binding protein [Marivirga harenae]|uniref:ABC transporter ATP-binding protein n=1 Tax=Marivirga harenae TaxID=2010992 RepID=UPI0026E04992|nr:ABC transporter ATP-binding protein [Marivirga harenae]WKV12976.1 ABC transporter ATP-binding protein [Marivirga harenae]